MKVAFITGASRGIGLAIAEELAAAGYHLALVARSRELLIKRGKELQEKYHTVCLCLAGDVGEADFVEEAFTQVRESLGQVDILVNNAGISHIGLLSEMRLEQWNQVMTTNLTSVFLCCRQAIPCMVARKQGRIINISSVWGYEPMLFQGGTGSPDGGDPGRKICRAGRGGADGTGIGRGPYVSHRPGDHHGRRVELRNHRV